jgi:hypothetical protein
MKILKCLTVFLVLLIGLQSCKKEEPELQLVNTNSIVTAKTVRYEIELEEVLDTDSISIFSYTDSLGNTTIDSVSDSTRHWAKSMIIENDSNVLLNLDATVYLYKPGSGIARIYVNDSLKGYYQLQNSTKTFINLKTSYLLNP